MDTPNGFRRLAPDRIREKVGLDYDELTEGLVIEHRPGRTVTETDSLLGATLSANAAPIHTDAHYAHNTEWKRILVCGGVTLNLVVGMSVRSISAMTTANLSLDNACFTAPVFVGDTLYAQTEVLKRRLSRSRPGEGIITCRTDAYNQQHTQVLTLTRAFLLPTDTEAVRGANNY